VVSPRLDLLDPCTRKHTRHNSRRHKVVLQGKAEADTHRTPFSPNLPKLNSGILYASELCELPCKAAEGNKLLANLTPFLNVRQCGNK